VAHRSQRRICCQKRDVRFLGGHRDLSWPQVLALGGLAREALPPIDDELAVDRVQFDQEGSALHLLAGDQGGSGARERI
jgi:hypothetical protein